jgi:hypothetical protein
MDHGKHGRVFLDLGQISSPPCGNERRVGRMIYRRGISENGSENLPTFRGSPDSGISIFEGIEAETLTYKAFGWCCQRGSNSRPLPYQGRYRGVMQVYEGLWEVDYDAVK